MCLPRVACPSRSAAVTAVAALLLSGCLGGREESEGWTVEQAEAVTEVRGLLVRVAGCRGLSRGERDGEALRYRRFACSAGARSSGDRFETVAVLYEIVVRDDSTYKLEAVRFVGGPGIP
ncbi:MAG TPA: hypothetical protein VF236_04555 [Gaiellaceae bacterium]